MINAVCLAVFGIGPTELVVVSAIVVLLFGHRLPEAMRGIGRGFKEFRDGASGIEQAKEIEEAAQ